LTRLKNSLSGGFKRLCSGLSKDRRLEARHSKSQEYAGLSRVSEGIFVGPIGMQFDRLVSSKRNIKRVIRPAFLNGTRCHVTALVAQLKFYA
jgi:hypothetical protein